MCESQGCWAWSARGLPVVSTPGEVDIASVGRLRGALLAASAEAGVVVVDMTETTFCDSSGLDLFAEICERLEGSGGELRVVVRSERVRHVMAVTGDDRLLRIFPSLDEALGVGQRHVLAGQGGFRRG